MDNFEPDCSGKRLSHDSRRGRSAHLLNSDLERPRNSRRGSSFRAPSDRRHFRKVRKRRYRGGKEHFQHDAFHAEQDHRIRASWNMEVARRPVERNWTSRILRRLRSR